MKTKWTKLEEFEVYDAAGAAYALETRQQWKFEGVKGPSRGAWVPYLKEVRLRGGGPVNRISDDEFVILDPMIPGGTTVRRRRE